MGKKDLKESNIKCKCCDNKGIYNHGEGNFLCKKHYDKLRNRGNLNAVENYKNGICEFNNCNNKATRRGLCGKHYQRFLKTGNRNYKTKSEIMIGRVCEIGGCKKGIKSKGLCGTHYRRFLVYGDPNIKKIPYGNYIKDEFCILCGNKIPQKFDSLKFCSYRCLNRHKTGKDNLDICICGKEFKSLDGALTCSYECKKLYKFLRTKGWNELQREKNPNYLRIRAAAQRRRHSKKKMVVVEKFSDIEIFERDDWTCGICNNFVEKDMKYPDPLCATIDHIVPISRGGGHTHNNVQLAHFVCNRKKGNKENYNMNTGRIGGKGGDDELRNGQRHEKNVREGNC